MNILKFRNGDGIPQLGLGTWKSKPEEVEQAVIHAIKTGYRHIDCAYIYDNEEAVGRGIQYCIENKLIDRDELFITSKLWNNAHEKEQVKPALKQTLSSLGLHYLDLYLIHWPVAQPQSVKFPTRGEELLALEKVPLATTWEGMEEIHQEGLAKHIGVSNFSISKLEALLENAQHTPEMNQVEMHPYLQQPDLFDFCRNHNILVTGYSPLGSGDRHPNNRRTDEPKLIADPTVMEISKQLNCTPAQVLIAWHLYRGSVVIPKSTNKQRIEENLKAQAVELSAAQMSKLTALNRNFRFIDGSFWTIDGSPYTLKNLWN